jgi:hypothetical protein
LLQAAIVVASGYFEHRCRRRCKDGRRGEPAAGLEQKRIVPKRLASCWQCVYAHEAGRVGEMSWEAWRKSAARRAVFDRRALKQATKRIVRCAGACVHAQNRAHARGNLQASPPKSARAAASTDLDAGRPVTSRVGRLRSAHPDEPGRPGQPGIARWMSCVVTRAAACRSGLWFAIRQPIRCKRALAQFAAGR